MCSLSRTLRFSAFALPIAMAAALTVRLSTESLSGYRLAGSAFLFVLVCWLARFQWRRSSGLEAVFFNARVLPTDSEATKLSADVVSLAAGVLALAAVLLKVF